MSTRRFATLALILGILAPVALHCQQLNHIHDHVLNNRGQSRITLATGIPYIAIGEYAYGVTDRITIGLLAGTTPSIEGYGVRARAVLYQPNNAFRIYFCTPLIYYPKTRGLGGDPWWLTRPNINFERITRSGFRYKAGASLIGAASHYTLFGDPSKAKFHPGLWNAVHAGFSLPLSSRLTLQVENSLVLRGVRVAGKDWVGGPPVILVLGTSWTL